MLAIPDSHGGFVIKENIDNEVIIEIELIKIIFFKILMILRFRF